MEDTKVTVEELKAILADDFDALVEEMAAAMNAAEAGRTSPQGPQVGDPPDGQRGDDD